MTHLKVAVRIRPLAKRELNSISVIDIENDQTVAITNIKVPEQNAGDSRERIRRFTFDYAFGETATQIQVFEAIENVIGKAIKNRYHSCVLAYGQSSSGKTHTMMGFPHDPGLTPKLCERLFDYLEETAVGNEVSDMKISVSYLEIYNEKVRDLLYQDGGDHRRVGLKIREHPKKGPYVQGLTERPVSSPSDLISCLETGNNKRRVAATLNNPQSSRSHSVFSVCCGGVKLHLVDLAGSERADNCYNSCRFREGANINKSLVALGNVISALAEQESTTSGKQQNLQRRQSKSPKRRFVPYRDSVLTWLLKDTLAGNSNTVMIATVSPSSACYSESVNTLRFGQRAKLIRSQPVLHQEDPNEKTIRQLRAEIARLRELLKLQTQLPPLDSMLPTHNKPQSELDSGLNTGISDTSSCSSLNLETDESDTLSAPATEDLNIIPEVPAENVDDSKLATEKLVPLMEVSSSIQKKKQKLHRTYSVEHATMDKEKPRFSSNENIRKSSVSSLPPLVRRQSMIKTPPKQSPKRVKQEVDKSVLTDIKGAKAKVDSIRKTPVKPRAQMIAAVTHRLYSKSKKKEVATDTDDINTYAKKELSICSNARMRLKELTQRALKAHRNRNEETQTDLYPVLRVKEISTDVDDLKMALVEIKDVETEMDQILTNDKAIECKINSMDSVRGVLITNSCGTQCDVTGDSCPIYTSSVNINISHNYLNGRTISEDSLEDNPQTINLPTPDLISNHNSLEQSSTDLKFADVDVIPNISESTLEKNYEKPQDFTALRRQTPVIKEKVSEVYLPKVCAPEICIVNNPREFCRPLHCEIPSFARPTLIEPKDIQCVDCVTIKEPLILKSIMRQVSNRSVPEDVKSTSSIDEDCRCEIPDSLEYHIANNKKVHFRKEKKCENQRMLKAMSSFLEEATTLMSNLTMAAHKFENFNEEYDVQVTLNDISGFPQHPKTRHHFTQTQDYPKLDKSTQSPINKYETLLEESCRRLEEKINFIPERSTTACSFDEKLPQPFSFHPWDLRDLEVEDSSLDSNPVTFSDYGSLPRRHHRRSRPTCTPSAYLKQLTCLRKQVIESSREELVNNTD